MINLDISKLSEKLPDINILYSDLAQPSLRKIGIGLETFFDFGNSLLLPLKLKSEKAQLNYKKAIETYSAELDKIEVHNIVPSPSEISVPVIDKVIYSNNDSLRNLFVRLLAKSSNIQTLHMAHPGFIRVIECLSEDEANLLNLISQTQSVNFASLQYRFSNRLNSSYRIVYKHMNMWRNECIFPDNFSLYIENLSSLGLVEASYLNRGSEMDVYDMIDNHLRPELQFVFPVDSENWELIFEHGVISLTSYGQEFIKTCVV